MLIFTKSVFQPQSNAEYFLRPESEMFVILFDICLNTCKLTKCKMLFHIKRDPITAFEVQLSSWISKRTNLRFLTIEGTPIYTQKELWSLWSGFLSNIFTDTPIDEELTTIHVPVKSKVIEDKEADFQSCANDIKKYS